MMLWALVFWCGTALLWLAYVGYPLLLWAGRRTQVAEAFAPSAERPALSASVVLVMRNEAARVQARLLNLLDGATSALKEVIVVCDGCSDATAAVARENGDARVRVLELEPGQGKPAGVNAGVAAATGEVVVLCDARQRFDAETIRRLLSWFDDPMTGAVSGALEIESSAGGVGKGVDAYWRLEKAIRQWESDLDSSVGCTGAVYAIRRSAFTLLPADTILDDVVVPMQIAAQGLRVRFDATALAFDPQTLGGATETRRKVRTLAGNFQMLARYAEWLLPWGHRLWWQLALHKYLRLAGPLLLVLMLASSLMLSGQVFYWWMLVGQIVFYAAALIGMMMPGLKMKLLNLPAGFVFLQVCVVRGFVSWLCMDAKGGWR